MGKIILNKFGGLVKSYYLCSLLLIIKQIKMKIIKLFVEKCYKTTGGIFVRGIRGYRHINTNSISYLFGVPYEDKMYIDDIDDIKGIHIHLIGGEVLYVKNESINTIKEKLK